MTRYTPLWLQSGSYAASVDRRLVGALYPSARVDGMAVSAASGTTVNVAVGTAAAPTPNNTGSTLCVSDAVEQVLLPAAPAAGLNRRDLVIVRPRGNDLDGGVNNDFIFDYVVGAEVASGQVDPAVPAGCVALASINRAGGSAAVAAGDITDRRPASLVVPAPYVPPPKPQMESKYIVVTTDSGGQATTTWAKAFAASPNLQLTNATTGGGGQACVWTPLSTTTTNTKLIAFNTQTNANWANTALGLVVFAIDQGAW